MRQVGIVPFRLGCATAEPLSTHCSQLYLWAAEAVTREQCVLSSKATPNTIPLDNYTIQHRPEEVYLLFTQCLNAHCAGADTLVVDVTDPFHGMLRAHVLQHVAAGVVAYLGSKVPNGADSAAKRCILLVPEPFPTEDNAIVALNPFMDEGRVTILADDGCCQPSSHCPSDFLPEQYRVRLALARGNPLELLKRKMIRRPGHFKKRDPSGQIVNCVRYFFDGSLCDKEVPQLIWEYLVAQYGTERLPCVFYHAPRSPWLEKAIISLSLDKKLAIQDLKALSEQSAVEFLTRSEELPPLLLVDLVDTGQTLAGLLRLLNKRRTNAKPRVLSVLLTNPSDPIAKTRTIQVGSDLFEVWYLLEVKQRVFPKGQCPMCRLDIPEAKPQAEGDYYMLTTYNHWDMAIPEGTKPEDDVPMYRRALAAALKYPQIIEQNGAWLAYKIRQRLDVEGFPSDAIVVCPDEAGSRILTDYLRLVLHVSIVRIPRDVINSCVQGGDLARTKAEWEASRPEWFRLLTSATDAEVVVMDEFNASGSTFVGMRNLLLQFGKRVMCFFPLNDLNPAWSRASDMTVHTLYSWQSYRPKSDHEVAK